MGKPARIGIFGGSFDPIHSAHCAIAREAMRQASLDRLFFVVAPRPPHKNDGPIASPEDRYAMVCAAVDGEKGMEISRVELDRPGKSYTIDTLRAFRDQCPESNLFLILGMDSLLELPKWKEPRQILELAYILAVPRPNLDAMPGSILDGHYTVLDFQKDHVSSTEIRQLIADGKPWEHLVPLGTRDVIREKRLYSCR